MPSRYEERDTTVQVQLEFSGEFVGYLATVAGEMQKVIRGIWTLLREPYIPFIDMMNRAEKFEIIASADTMLEIRELRNQIAHEYLPEKLNELITDIMELYPLLQQNIKATKIFLIKRTWIEDH